MWAIQNPYLSDRGFQLGGVILTRVKRYRWDLVSGLHVGDSQLQGMEEVFPMDFKIER